MRFSVEEHQLPDTIKLHNLIDALDNNRPIDPHDYGYIRAVLATMYVDPLYKLKQRVRVIEKEKEEARLRELHAENQRRRLARTGEGSGNA